MMQQSDRAGLLFALAGFCTLSIGDVVVKGMDGMWPSTGIAMLRYTLAAIGLSALLAWKGGAASLLAMPRAGIQWLRGLGVALATVAFFTGVWLMPLADAMAITFVQPMLTAVLATMFLGERLKSYTIVAIVVAFTGVLMVLRPNFAVIGWGALLPLVAALGMAILMTANRAAAGAASALAMQAYIANTASVLLIAACAIGHFSGVEEFRLSWPSLGVIVRCAIVACTATCAHLMIYLGTTRAGASTVAPMTYGQLLAAIALGWIFFAEVPDALTLLGSAIIVGAGLFLWAMGRKRVIGEAPS